MSDQPHVQDRTGVFIRISGIIVAVVGAVMLVSGITTWALVQSQLSDEQITVSQDAASNAGKKVNGPFTAYSQAEVIKKHALEASGGKTYAQLERDDPTRSTVMDASFLRASLFTSVLAFGVSLMAGGLGIVLVLVGLALYRLAPART